MRLVETPEPANGFVCTADEIKTIVEEFDRADVWQQTECPEPSWIDEYHKLMAQDSVAVLEVGCNNAFDAVASMR